MNKWIITLTVMLPTLIEIIEKDEDEDRLLGAYTPRVSVLMICILPLVFLMKREKGAATTAGMH